MARKPRIHYPGAFYHVMLRGNAKQSIFKGPEGVRQFETILGQGSENCDVRIYAYCWMPNHVHMALQVDQIPLSKMMQNLSQRYTRWFNKYYDRVGHLFQGRYKAILVDGQGYMLELIRYIHLNPVRAGLVADALEYENSSHGAYLAPDRAPDWLCVDSGLKFFGPTETAAQARYLHFMGETVADESLDMLRKGNLQGRILGDDDFVRKVMDTVGESQVSELGLKTLTRVVAEKLDLPPHHITSGSRNRSYAEARAIIALLAIDYTTHGLNDVADFLGRDITTMSKQVTKLRDRRTKFASLHDKIDQLAAEITPISQA